MEYGLHNEVATEFDDIGEIILQWGYRRDKLRAEIKQNFPQTPHSNVSSTSTSTVTITQKPMPNVRPIKSNDYKQQGRRDRTVQYARNSPMSFDTCVGVVILQAVSFNHIQMRTTTLILQKSKVPTLLLTFDND